MTAIARITTDKPHGPAVTDWIGTGLSGEIKVGHGFTTTHERSLGVHEHLFIASDTQSHIHQVLDGVIGVYKMLADGRRQIVNFYYPGDLIGVDESGTWMHHGEAICASKVRCIPISTIDSLITSEPGFGQALLATLSVELAEARDQLLTLGRKSALEKVATFLLRISRRNARYGADDSTLHLPMSRSEIGDYLGLTIETVCRSITRLKKANIIELEGNCQINITDKEHLTVIANGDG